jgi:hypothetical protein
VRPDGAFVGKEKNLEKAVKIFLIASGVNR